MPEAPEKLDLRSLDLSEEKRQELLRLFPEIRTEGGKIDFDRLKLVLGGTVDVGKERYGMHWPGKADCFKTIQAPSMGTLRPCPEESINWDTTENLIIEGDNLEVLKLLQKSYLGRVNMIYIDPPYNTGNDFIYPDNYSESLQTYLEYTGQVDAQGNKFSSNTDKDGRFHSKWLNMMFTRLYVARNLMADNAVVFISIDDSELHNCLRVSDELFGEENRVGIISWKNVTDNNPTLITSDNEYILCYAKNIAMLPKSWSSLFSASKDALQCEYDRLKSEGNSNEVIQARIREFISDNEETVGFLSRYKHVDDDGVYTGSESVHNPRPGGYDFEVLHPQTSRPMRKPSNGYRFPEATFREMEAHGIILYGQDENRIVKIKKYLHDYEDALRSIINLDGRLGSYELKRLFPNSDAIFTNPKPSELIESLISFVTDKNSVVLDFFAGSGSTAHAVLSLNSKDGGNRKFILVQLPEPTRTQKKDGTWETTPAWDAGLETISEITKERVRRVIDKLKVRNEMPSGGLFMEERAESNQGFRVYKLSDSNFNSWDANVSQEAGALAQQLELYIDHIKEGRSDNDLLFEILIKRGFPLTTQVETLTLAGHEVYGVAGTMMLVCLQRDLSLELIRAMADLNPECVVCLDEGFAGNDQLKTNAVQIFKTKGVAKFLTV